MAIMADIIYPTKPPKYWMAAKQRAGINPAGAGRIWYHTYNNERRLFAWLAADAAEWRAYGLRKP